MGYERKSRTSEFGPIEARCRSVSVVGGDDASLEWGATSFDQDEAELLRVMVERARRHVAVVDHTKLGKVANWTICQSRRLHALVTDTQATDEMIAPFREMGIEIIRA